MALSHGASLQRLHTRWWLCLNVQIVQRELQLLSRSRSYALPALQSRGASPPTQLDEHDGSCNRTLIWRKRPDGSEEKEQWIGAALYYLCLHCLQNVLTSTFVKPNLCCTTLLCKHTEHFYYLIDHFICCIIL